MNLIDVNKKIEETKNLIGQNLESKKYDEVKSLVDQLEEFQTKKKYLEREIKFKTVEPLLTNRFEVEFDNEELNYFNFCVQEFQDLYDMNPDSRLIVITFLGTMSTKPKNVINALKKTYKLTLKLLDPTLLSIDESVYNIKTIKHIELPKLSYGESNIYQFKVTLSYY